MRTLMPVRTSGSKPPLFCIHGEPLKMAQAIDAERPLYGIYFAYDPNFTPPETMQKLAAMYLRELRLVQPRGPYYLVGFCVGGLAAFEMARQLVASGEEVAYLGLLDPTNPGRAYSRVDWVKSTVAIKGQRLAAVSYFVKRGCRALVARSKVALLKLRANAYEIVGAATPFHLREILHNRKIRLAFRDYRYRPAPLSGIIFRPEASDEKVAVITEQWRKILSGGASVIAVPGLLGHSDFMAEPYHTIICQTISQHLESRQTHAGPPSGFPPGAGNVQA